MFRQNHIYRHSKAHFEWDDFVRFRELCNINITEVKDSDGLWSICICQKTGYPKTHLDYYHASHSYVTLDAPHVWTNPSAKIFKAAHFLECDFPTEACVVVTPRWIIEHIGQLLEDATCETRASGRCFGMSWARQTVLMWLWINTY